MNSEADGEHESEKRDALYASALERVARAIGVETSELDRRLVETAESMPLTPDCLSLGEVHRYPTLTSLPKERRDHVQRCEVCTELMQAIAPDPAQAREFAKRAAKSGRQRKMPPFQWRWRPAALGAFAASLVLLPAMWGVLRATQTQQESLADVFSTLLVDQANTASQTEQQLRILLAKHETEPEDEQAVFSVAMNSLTAQQRSLEARRAALLAAESQRSLSFTGRLRAANTTPSPSGRLLTETLYLDLARHSCLLGVDHTEADAATFEAAFSRLEELVRSTRPSELSWARVYVPLHQQVETLANEFVKKNAQHRLNADDSVSLARSAEKLQLCDTFLEEFASVRVANWTPNVTRSSLPAWLSAASR